MKHHRPLAYSLIASIALPLTVAVLTATVGCAKVTTAGGGTGANNGTGGNPFIGGGTGGQGPLPSCVGQCTDFPSTPILDPGISGDPGSMFSGAAPTFGGPCITEPEDGTLYPNNWMRPRIKFDNTGNKLIQIRMHAANQQNDLLAYTTNNFWIVDGVVWAGLRGHQVGGTNTVTVTVWIQGAGASTTHFNTAPVGASGNMIFWAADPTVVGVMPSQCAAMPMICNNAAELRAFAVGSETTQSVLQISQVLQPSRLDSGAATKVTCIGCHSGTPDAGFVLFVDNYPWRAASASVQMGLSGTSWTTSAAGLNALLQPGWGPFTFTKSNGFWLPQKRIMVGSLGLLTPNVPDHSNGPDQNDSPHLAWINLEGTAVRAPVNGDQGNWDYTTFAPAADITSGNALGFIAHNGDPNGAATPNWSHDGTTIAYASTNAALSGRLNIEATNTLVDGGTDPKGHPFTRANNNSARVPGQTNIFTVPFNNGLGGTATPVSGAATSQSEEYYPAFSPDDKLLAFTFVPAGQVMYANPEAQIAVVAKEGGNPTVLRANTPPMCTGKSSPGVNNHWPKWSPEVQPGPDGTYYWLIFSSNRTGVTALSNYDHQNHIISQLYVAPVVVTEFGITPYPAIYLWNQPADHVNTTPAWESFALPPIP